MDAFWDRLGISASLLCVIHCLITPLLVLIAPLAGSYLSDAWFHIVILIIVFPVAILALWRGYRLHQMKRALWLGAAGLTLMLFGMFATHDVPYETVLMVSAGLTLSAAHFFNLRACRRNHSH